MYKVNVKDVEKVPVAKEAYRGKRIWAQYLITDKQGSREISYEDLHDRAP